MVAVVDSGLARVARHSPWSGLPRLDVEKISRDILSYHTSPVEAAEKSSVSSTNGPGSARLVSASLRSE